VGTTGANILIGGAGNDFLSGMAGDDVLNGGSGVDQLFGGDGADTVTYANSTTAVEIYLNNGVSWDGTSTDFLNSIENVIGSTHGDFIVGTGGANVIDGGTGTDTVAFSGNRAAYTISLAGGVTTITGPDGTDSLTNVERLRFADGLFDISGNPVPASSAEAPQVLPALTDDKVPSGPEVLPAAPVDTSKSGQAEVLPAMTDDGRKADFAQVLPGEAIEVTMSGRDQLQRVDWAPRDGNTADTLFQFDGPADDGYLLAGLGEGTGPQVLPAMDDGFLLTAKFDSFPPVMPVLDSFDTGGVTVTEMEQARELMMALVRENPLDGFGDNLTLLDDWSGVTAPSRGDVWA
jgi:hypothetical protein